MDAVRVLRLEHVLILKQLACIEDEARELSGSDLPDRTRLTGCLLEKCKAVWLGIFEHIRKEEEALFPMLEDQLGERQGLVPVVRSEHGDIIGAMISLFVEILRSVGSSAKPLDNYFVNRVQNLRLILSDHVAREDKVLFWLIDLQLPALDRRKLSQEFAKLSPLN